jgi:hypothetical protein
VVGILGIIFGALGVIGGAQLMMMPSTMRLQKEIMSDMERTMEEARPNRRGFESPPVKMSKVFDKMLDTPEWFDTWCRIGGPLAMLISGFYIFAAVRVLQIKPGAVGLFCSAAGLSIALSLTKVGIALSLASLMSIGMVMGGVVGGIVDVVLIIVVVSGNKKMLAAQAA